MLTTSALAGLNHLLADAPWARTRLAPFAGRSARFVLKPLSFGFGVDREGYFCEAATDAPDVSLELPLAALPKALGGPDALTSDIRISGNADFADALGFVLRQLRWDGEEALARLVGDIAAHRGVEMARGVIDWHRQAACNVVENFAEYLGEEKAVLVRQAALDDLARHAADLRDDLARLEKRLKKLENGR